MKTNPNIQAAARRAAMNGKTIKDCPFDVGTDEYIQWTCTFEMEVFSEQQKRKVKKAKIHKTSTEKKEAAFLSACGLELSYGFFSEDVSHWKEKEPEVYRFFMERADV